MTQISNHLISITLAIELTKEKMNTIRVFMVWNGRKEGKRKRISHHIFSDEFDEFCHLHGSQPNQIIMHMRVFAEKASGISLTG